LVKNRPLVEVLVADVEAAVRCEASSVARREMASWTTLPADVVFWPLVVCAACDASIREGVTVRTVAPKLPRASATADRIDCGTVRVRTCPLAVAWTLRVTVRPLAAAAASC
jgi:hypothetical protein